MANSRLNTATALSAGTMVRFVLLYTSHTVTSLSSDTLLTIVVVPVLYISASKRRA